MGKCLQRKAGQPWKQGDTAESHMGGGVITIASLPTRQHQQLNSGECLTVWTTEEDPSQGGPSRCLRRQTAEKDPRQGRRLSAEQESYRERLA